MIVAVDCFEDSVGEWSSFRVCVRLQEKWDNVWAEEKSRSLTDDVDEASIVFVRFSTMLLVWRHASKKRKLMKALEWWMASMRRSNRMSCVIVEWRRGKWWGATVFCWYSNSVRWRCKPPENKIPSTNTIHQLHLGRWAEERSTQQSTNYLWSKLKERAVRVHWKLREIVEKNPTVFHWDDVIALVFNVVTSDDVMRWNGENRFLRRWRWSMRGGSRYFSLLGANWGAWFVP